MPLKPHPTDPDKMVYVARKYNLQKEWVGLTDKEIMKCYEGRDPEWDDYIAFAAAIEAKLKEKNT